MCAPPARAAGSPPRPRRRRPGAAAGGPGALPYLATGAGAAGSVLQPLPTAAAPGARLRCAAGRGRTAPGTAGRLPQPPALGGLAARRALSFGGGGGRRRAGQGEAGGAAEAARGLRGAGSAATLQRLQESLPREAAHHPRPAALIGCGAGRRAPAANRPAPSEGGAAAPAAPIPRPRVPVRPVGRGRAAAGGGKDGDGEDEEGIPARGAQGWHPRAAAGRHEALCRKPSGRRASRVPRARSGGGPRP
ncbi:uncharacterized protein LOC143694067 [Agelaius phoeniceus]|uniref:uncharacterized protein LOC143694067 n=1 Tax=Agelaius phoeniceus TaxID=39638 RepID=UPI0040552D1B